MTKIRYVCNRTGHEYAKSEGPTVYVPRVDEEVGIQFDNGPTALFKVVRIRSLVENGPHANIVVFLEQF